MIPKEFLTRALRLGLALKQAPTLDVSFYLGFYLVFFFAIPGRLGNEK